MPKNQARYDTVSIVLHWSVGISIIAIAAIELLRGENFSKGKLFSRSLEGPSRPGGDCCLRARPLAPVLAFGPFVPAMPESMRSWEKGAARLTHYTLYAMMVAIPLTGIAYTLARGRPIDFGLFQIVYPLDRLFNGSAAGTLKNVHEFLGQAVLALAFLHAAGALWHHHIRKDDVLTRMLPILTLEK